MNNEVLSSWKEIAAYLGRGVRTVQRWEHDLALPVRRPRGRERSAVIALKSDLDKWLHETPQSSIVEPKSDPLRHEKLQINTQQLLKRTHEILEQSTKIQQMVRGTMALTIQLKTRQAERLRERAGRAKMQQALANHTTRVFSNGVERQARAGGD